MPTVLDLVGKTPLVEIQHVITKPGVQVFAKLEGQNPGGSVKDRAAASMIKGALDSGILKPGMKLIEATSGNTGIALAMIARLYNIDIDLVMPEHATPERVKTMKAYGANVILTPTEKSMEGAIDYAHEQVKKGGFVMLNQFANPDNYLAHYRTTGPEIWEDTKHEVTHFVSAMGTTGTIMGTSRYLKEQNEKIQIVGAQPLDGSRIPGIRRWPKEYLPKIFEPDRVDQIIDVSQDEATEMSKKLATQEGIFCGMSSGGACAVASKLVQQIDKGTIVFIVCDRGDRYLSSALYS